MTLPDFTFLVAGTPIVWKSSGGDKVITLTSLAALAAREGAKSDTLIDGTLGMPELLRILFESAPASTMANGDELELFIGESNDATAGTNNPGALTGADALLPSYEDELVQQLDTVGSLPWSNGETTNIQKILLIHFPINPFIIPVVNNPNATIALSSTATDHTITMVPYYRKIAD